MAVLVVKLQWNAETRTEQYEKGIRGIFNKVPTASPFGHLIPITEVERGCTNHHVLTKNSLNALEAITVRKIHFSQLIRFPSNHLL